MIKSLIKSSLKNCKPYLIRPSTPSIKDKSKSLKSFNLCLAAIWSCYLKGSLKIKFGHLEFQRSKARGGQERTPYATLFIWNALIGTPAKGSLKKQGVFIKKARRSRPGAFNYAAQYSAKTNLVYQGNRSKILFLYLS